MWSHFSEIYTTFITRIGEFKTTDVLDIMVVSFIIYNLIKIIRETRAVQLVKGIMLILVMFVLSGIFNLRMLNTLFTSFFQFSVLAVLIMFQPELRSALEHLGRSKIGKYWSGFTAAGTTEESKVKRLKRGINCVCEAANNFQKSKTGALIVFERQTKLGDIIDTGTIVNAVPSVPMIGNIFFNKAPLHDGAMVVRDGMIYAAGCILPLTKDNNSVSVDLGTRHRAGLGISENSDAVVVIVSEETGTISMALNGVITRNYTRETLNAALEELIIPKEPEKIERIPVTAEIKKGRKNDKNKK